jgi:hypothetical protein
MRRKLKDGWLEITPIAKAYASMDAPDEDGYRTGSVLTPHGWVLVEVGTADDEKGRHWPMIRLTFAHGGKFFWRHIRRAYTYRSVRVTAGKFAERCVEEWVKECLIEGDNDD